MFFSFKKIFGAYFCIFLKIILMVFSPINCMLVFNCISLKYYINKGKALLGYFIIIINECNKFTNYLNS